MSKEGTEPRAGIQEAARLSGTWRRFEQAGEALDSAKKRRTSKRLECDAEKSY
jgi:hypothetical protein